MSQGASAPAASVSASTSSQLTIAEADGDEDAVEQQAHAGGGLGGAARQGEQAGGEQRHRQQVAGVGGRRERDLAPGHGLVERPGQLAGRPGQGAEAEQGPGAAGGAGGAGAHQAGGAGRSRSARRGRRWRPTGRARSPRRPGAWRRTRRATASGGRRGSAHGGRERVTPSLSSAGVPGLEQPSGCSAPTRARPAEGCGMHSLLPARAPLERRRPAAPCGLADLDALSGPVPFLAYDLDVVADRVAAFTRAFRRSRRRPLRRQVQPGPARAAAPSPPPAAGSRSPRSPSSTWSWPRAPTPPTCSTATRSSRRRTSRPRPCGACAGSRSTRRRSSPRSRGTRPGAGGLRAAVGRRHQQPLPAVQQVRHRRTSRRAACCSPRPTTGPAPRRPHLPRRLAVHRPGRLGARRRPPSARCCASSTATGVRLRLLDLGGGFPARYSPAEQLPGAATTSRTRVLTRARRAALRARRAGLRARPGRGRRGRGARRHRHRPGGARRAGSGSTPTSAPTTASWRRPRRPGRCRSRCGPRGTGRARPTARCTLTGPSCDSSDTLLRDVELPADLEVGDRVFLGSAGAYSPLLRLDVQRLPAAPLGVPGLSAERARGPRAARRARAAGPRPRAGRAPSGRLLAALTAPTRGGPATKPP